LNLYGCRKATGEPPSKRRKVARDVRGVEEARKADETRGAGHACQTGAAPLQLDDPTSNVWSSPVS